MAEPEVGRGARLYSSLLQRAGGEPLHTLMRRGGEQGVCAALYAAPPYELDVPPMEVARLSLNLTPSRVVGGAAGERALGFDAQRYSLFLAPAGAGMRWRKEAPSRHLTLYFRREVFADCEQSATPLAGDDALHNLQVPGSRAIADELIDELRQGGWHNPDATDCLARLLLIRISRHLGKRRHAASRMDAATASRLKDYVMAHLEQRIRVSDLSSQAGMPLDRFASAFKAHTGQSPHQYVVALRLQHAAHLLATSRLSIAEVAHACGFSSQQHLTHALRRHAGLTPARYRQVLGSAAAAPPNGRDPQADARR